MRKNLKEKLAKIVLVVTILCTMLVPYFPVVSNGAETEDADYVKFNASCESGSTVKSKSYVSMKYDFTLAGVQSGFKNVKLTIKDTDSTTPTASIWVGGDSNKIDENTTITNNGKYTVIEYGNLTTGVHFEGNASLYFQNDKNFNDYVKTITFLLETDYKDPVQNITVHEQIEKNVTVTVESVTEQDRFFSYVNMNTTPASGQMAPGGVTSNYRVQYEYYNDEEDYCISKVFARFKYKMNFENICYGKFTQKLTKDEYGVADLNQTIGEDYVQVDLSGVPDIFDSEIKRNNDGTVDIVLTYKEKKDAYTIADMEDELSEIFYINVTYKMAHDSTYYETNQNGLSIFRNDWNAITEGIDIYTDKNGSRIEKIEKRFSGDDCLSVKTHEKDSTNGASQIAGMQQTVAQYSSDIEKGYLEVSYLSTQGVINRHEKDGSTSAESPYYYVANFNTEGEIAENINLVQGVNPIGPSLSYLDEDGEKVEVQLIHNEMYLSKIEVTYKPYEVDEIQFYKRGETTPFFTATSQGDSYICPDKNIKEYYAVTRYKPSVANYSVRQKKTVQWKSSWKIDKNSLTSLGLTNENIDNIVGVIRHQYCMTDINSALGDPEYVNSTLGPNGEATIIDPESLYAKVSYMTLDIGDFGTSNTNFSKENKTIQIKMYKDTTIFTGNETLIYNQNPTVYVRLPEMFEYENINVNITDNSYLSIKNTEIVTVDSKQYLKIELDGTYSSHQLSTFNIDINFDRTLVDSTASRYQSIDAYMITENENYYTEYANENSLTYGEVIPAKLYKTVRGFNIDQSTIIRVTSAIQRGIKTYIPNVDNTSDDWAEKTYPMIVKNDSVVTYVGDIQTVGKSLTNVSLLYKLPVNNNTAIQTGSEESAKLIDDDYELSTNFYTKFSSKLNDAVNANGTVKHISKMTNLSNIKLYAVSNAVETEISSYLYKIYYSNNIDATFDSPDTDFEEYQAGVSDVSNAKVLKVKLLTNVPANTCIRLKYDMTMPNEKGMVGAVMGARYLENGQTDETTLDSEAVYIINGNELTSIKVQKVFEGYAVGTAPAGVSLSGIQFKLKDKNGNFVQNGGVDLVATTDATGMAIFSGLPRGQYQLVELSTFTGFDTIGNLVYVTTDFASTTPVDAVNPRKKGTVNITKTFEDTNEIMGRATFMLTRTSTDSIVYVKSVTTDDEGKASFVGVPYGTYTLREISPVNGYGTPNPIEVTVDEETESVEVENPRAYGQLVINKKVPEGCEVDELKFKITGLGDLNYTNKIGDQVSTDTNITVDLSQDYTDVDNIETTISTDKLSATITLSNLPTGLYTVEEVDIPKVGEEQLEKYSKVLRTVQISSNDLNKEVTIVNRKKYGYLKIRKTAYIPNGEDRELLSDLSQFRVNITGTSGYGTIVDRTISLDEDGNADLALEIGTYTVKEIEADGYETYYKVENGDLRKLANGIQVNIGFNETAGKGTITTQEIVNELTGVGYVRVNKKLEGITDANKVKDAGIRFRISGRNQAGVMIPETYISIDKVDGNDTDGYVAYGICGPLSVGGDYELEEISNTVPNYYEGMTARAINVTTSTEDNPVVIDVDNLRTKGDLEIVTKTNPEGGPLAGIKYKVTEITLNKVDGKYNGTYTKVTETEQTIEGSNNPSDASYAKLAEIYAGMYLVEMDEIPDGYNKDLAQVVEVPSYGTGNVEFVINRNDFVQYNQVIINKQLLNESNEEASSEDIANAQLDANEQFEVKIKNVSTGKEYYAYTSTAKNAVICDLPAGTYSVEEVYKPKYTLVGYYKSTNGIVTEPLDQNEEEEYVFSIKRGTSKQKNTVEITVKNKINTNVPFGGQTSKNNYSKVEIENVNVETKVAINVTNENGDAIPGAVLNIVDKDNNVLKTITTTDNKQIEISGLEPGAYTIEYISVPTGYIIPADTDIVVYEDVVTAPKKIEVQTNVPRAKVTLSTTYISENGTAKYTPRSKYKIVDTETGKPVTFTRTATGNYIKSNLEDAVEVISLKSAPVEVTGLEVGTYEIGLVDVTSGFAVQSDLPETVVLAENEDKTVNTQVIQPQIVDVIGGEYTVTYLDKSGQVWSIGKMSSGEFGIVNITKPQSALPVKAEFPEENVIITKLQGSKYNRIALDSQGRIWVWGVYSSDFNIGYTYSPGPVCISKISGKDLTNAYNNGVIITDICYMPSGGCIMLDSEGKLWVCGQDSSKNGTGYRSAVDPICLTTLNENPNIENHLRDAYNNGVKIVKLANYNGRYSGASGVIDSEGKVWMWGDNTGYTIPTCISDIESDFSSAEIVQLSIGDEHNLAIDKQGNVWGWGRNGTDYYKYGYLCSSVDTYVAMPKNLSEYVYEGRKIFNGKKIEKVFALKYMSMFVDEDGELWACGNAEYGKLGNGETSGYVCEPVNISQTSDLKGRKVVAVSQTANTTIILDDKGTLWQYGSLRCDSGHYCVSGLVADYATQSTPIKVVIDYTKHLEYNLKFVKIAQIRGCYSMGISALDENGNVWVKGYKRYNGMGDMTYYGEGFELNPVLEGKNIIDIDVDKESGYVSIALSKSGDVYVYGYGYYVADFTGQNSFIPVNITENFNLVGDTKIVDVALTNYKTAIALDSNGKVWTWGRNSDYGLNGGFTTSYMPRCISDNPECALYGVKIASIYGANYSVFAIDEDGKIWVWGRYNDIDSEKNTLPSDELKPICVSDINGSNLCYAKEQGVKFVKISADQYEHSAALDSNGKVWILNGKNGLGEDVYGKGAYCVNDAIGHPIYNESQKYENYKIVDIHTDYQGVYATDSNGTTWIIMDNAVVEFSQAFGYRLPKDVKEISSLRGGNGGRYMIDGEGQLWEMNTGVCEIKHNMGVINSPVENSLYNVKFEDVINDQIAKDKNGNYWFFPSGNGQAINISQKLAGKDNPLYGKEVVDAKAGAVSGTYYFITSDNKMYYYNSNNQNAVAEYVMDTMPSDVTIEKIEYNLTIPGKEYYIAFDSNGKIWTCGSGYYGQLGNGGLDFITEPICLNDTEGTGLYESKASDNTFKISELIVKASNDKNSIFALDNKGGLWTWGYNSNGNLGNNTNKYSTIPVCINKVSGTDFGYANASDNNFKIEKVEITDSNMYLTDNYGKIWVCGYNNYGQLGTGNTNNVITPTCLLASEYSNDSNFRIEKAIIDTSLTASNILLDNYGKVWVCGYNNYGKLGTGDTDNVVTLDCISNKLGTDFANMYINDSSFKIENIEMVNNSLRMTDNYGKIWGCGYNNFGQLGNGTTSDVLTPTCLLESQYAIDSNFRIEKIYGDSYDTIILDNYGKVWVCGYNNYGELGTGDTSRVTIPDCISNKSGTDFTNMYINDSNFKIEKVYLSGYKLFMVDNYGKVWVCGRNSYGELGNGATGSIFTPTCLCENSQELADAYSADSNFKITDIYSGGDRWR